MSILTFTIYVALSCLFMYTLQRSKLSSPKIEELSILYPLWKEAVVLKTTNWLCKDSQPAGSLIAWLGLTIYGGCSFRSMTTFPFAASIQSTFPLKEDENCTDLEGMYMNMITWSSQYAHDKVLVFGYAPLRSDRMLYCNQTPFSLREGGVWVWDYLHLGSWHAQRPQALIRMMAYHGHVTKPHPLWDENNLNSSLTDYLCTFMSLAWVKPH